MTALLDLLRPVTNWRSSTLLYSFLTTSHNHWLKSCWASTPGALDGASSMSWIQHTVTLYNYVGLYSTIWRCVTSAAWVYFFDCLLTISGVFGVFTADSAKIHKRVSLSKVQGGDSAAAALYHNSGSTSRNAAPTCRSFSCVSPHPCYRHYTLPRCREGTTTAGSSGHHFAERRRHIAVCRLAPASCPFGRSLGSLTGHRNYLESVFFLCYEVP